MPNDRDCDFPNYRSEDSDNKNQSRTRWDESSCWGNGCIGCLVAWFAIGFLVNKCSSSLIISANNSSPKEANQFFNTNISRVEQLILQYQKDIRPILQANLENSPVCIYEPSCSEYGLEAVRRYGDFRGGALAAGRIIRCNPFAKGGHDPVR